MNEPYLTAKSPIGTAVRWRLASTCPVVPPIAAPTSRSTLSSMFPTMLRCLSICGFRRLLRRPGEHPIAAGS